MRIELHNGDSEKLLGGFGISGPKPIVSDLALGIAAEHLVCADLLLSGFRAFSADQNCPYDVAVEHNRRLIRLQVKSTRVAAPIGGRPNQYAYQWNVRRGGKGGARVYGIAEFDALALVAIDIRKVAYLAVSEAVLQTVHLKAPGSFSGHANRKRRNVDEYLFWEVVEQLSKQNAHY